MFCQGLMVLVMLRDLWAPAVPGRGSRCQASWPSTRVLGVVPSVLGVQDAGEDGRLKGLMGLGHRVLGVVPRALEVVHRVRGVVPRVLGVVTSY